MTKINNKKSKNSVNQISFKCLYEIKDYNYTQIINNQFEHFINNDIEPKIKILNNNKKESLIFQKRFEKLGLNEIDFIIEEKLNNMCFMFNNCTSLKQIKFISIDTSQVTDMSRMFFGCNELELIDISSFDTSNVTNMEAMFAACNKLKEIKGINKINTSKVTLMSIMFVKCQELEYLDLSNFDTSSVTEAFGLFAECYKLKEIRGINKFNTSK